MPEWLTPMKKTNVVMMLPHMTAEFKPVTPSPLRVITAQAHPPSTMTMTAVNSPSPYRQVIRRVASMSRSMGGAEPGVPPSDGVPGPDSVCDVAITSGSPLDAEPGRRCQDAC